MPSVTQPPPLVTTPDVSARMAAQARRDTAPELALRSRLFSRGERYRVNFPIPGLSRRTIDIAFPHRRVAVFVDGCFWHSCPVHASSPKQNGEWWARKLAANRDRDSATDAFLLSHGWTVVRVWEHEDTAEACSRVLEAVQPPSERGPR